ncbi:MAG: branched-chain amino acid ABC transporter permease [Candidatus Dormibacteria bacterium]
MVYVQVALNGIFLAGFYLVMAQGLNLIFGVMRIVNFAHGAIIVLGGLTVYSLSTAAHINPFLGLVIVAVAAFFIGAGVQWLVIERARGTNRSQQELLTLMVTFGLSYIMINFGQKVWGSEFKSLPYLQSAVAVGDLHFPVSLLVGFGLAATITGMLSIWLAATTLGKSLRATAQSTVGAASCGINPRRVRMIGFGLGSSLAAAAGMLLVLTEPIAPQFANGFTVTAFVVIALGGLGNYAGAAVGALLVGLGQTFGGFELGTIAQNATPYVLLILVMLLRPQGLLPQRTR